jgi:rod shape-determining protein MreC
MVRAIDPRRSRMLLAGMIVLHLVLVSRQVDTPGGGTLLDSVVFTLLSPVQSLVGWGVRGVREGWGGYIALWGEHRENERLRERLGYLDALLQRRQGKVAEVERLRGLLGLRQILPLETSVAEVIAGDGMPWFRTLTIDKGARDRVTLNAPVISPSGVIGRVVALGPHAARVQVILDPQCGVGVRIERSRITGVVSGLIASRTARAPEAIDTGSGELALRYVPALGDVVVGDVVVTSGLDQIFPKGLMIGRVQSVKPNSSGLFKEIVVAPSARFERLEEVLVLHHVPQDVSVTEWVK